MCFWDILFTRKGYNEVKVPLTFDHQSKLTFLPNLKKVKKLSLDLEECDRQTNGQTTRKHNGQAMTIASTEALKCYKGNHNFYINGHFYTYIGQT